MIDTHEGAISSYQIHIHISHSFKGSCTPKFLQKMQWACCFSPEIVIKILFLILMSAFNWLLVELMLPENMLYISLIGSFLRVCIKKSFMLNKPLTNHGSCMNEKMFFGTWNCQYPSNYCVYCVHVYKCTWHCIIMTPHTKGMQDYHTGRMEFMLIQFI